jgi:ParB family chromosome partitioning protein
MPRKSAAASSPEAVLRISLERLQPSSRNPRGRLRRLDELAESIRMYGIMQPLVVRPLHGGRYEIVAGHRRFAAAEMLGWTDVPAVVRSASADHAYLLALVENLQRDDLSPKEEAAALQALMLDRNWTASQVAKSIQRSVAYVSRHVRVFEDPVLAPLVLAGHLTVSVAEELLPLPERLKQTLAQQAIDGQWERREVRDEIARSLHSSRSQTLGVQRKAHELRKALQGLWAGHLSDGDRRELRLLFHDLAVLAKATAAAEQATPVLPQAASRRGGRSHSERLAPARADA